MALTKPMAKYAHVRRVGSLAFIAGQGARDPVTDAYAGLTLNAAGQVTSYDISAQTAAVLTNIERALKSVDLDRRHIVDITVFLTDMRDFDAMNHVWNDFFREHAAPTRTTVAVKQLPGLNYVEMKAIAAFSDAT